MKFCEFFQEYECTNRAIKCLKGKIEMVQYIESNLFSEDAINICILLIFPILSVCTFMLLIGELQKNPCIIFILFLNKTAVVHKNNKLLGILLTLLLSEETAIKLVDSFSHTNCVTFLFDGCICGYICYYFCLLDIRFNGFLLRRF